MDRLSGFINRGRGGDAQKSGSLRFCILEPDFSGVKSDDKGWFVANDAETIVQACQSLGGIPSTIQAAEQILKLNKELDDLVGKYRSLEMQLDRSLQHSSFAANKQTLVSQERDEAVRRAERLEEAIRTAMTQLNHLYNDAPDWLESDTHGWIKAAALGLRNALSK